MDRATGGGQRELNCVYGVLIFKLWPMGGPGRSHAGSIPYLELSVVRVTHSLSRKQHTVSFGGLLYSVTTPVNEGEPKALIGWTI